MTELANVLAKSVYRKYALLTGCGTAGLYIALKALGLQEKYIAIPNNVCYSVPLAVLLSGNVPIFLDIEPNTLGLALHSLEANCDRLDTVIAVHAYGITCDIKRISNLCGKRGLVLIEDCAVAQGAYYQDQPVGSFGDVSVFSFGAGKIIDVGHGGALLTDDKSLYEEFVRIDRNLPEYSTVCREKIKELGACYKRLYNQYYLNNQIAECLLFREKVEELKSAFLFRFSRSFEETILHCMATLRKNLSARQKSAQKLVKYLADANGRVQIFRPPAGAAIWRLNLFVKYHRNRLFKHLLEQGYKISSWFPSVDIFFQRRSECMPKTPTSDWVGDHILNIWVNDEIDDGYLKNLAHDIVEFSHERVLQ